MLSIFKKGKLSWGDFPSDYKNSRFFTIGYESFGHCSLGRYKNVEDNTPDQEVQDDSIGDGTNEETVLQVQKLALHS